MSDDRPPGGILITRASRQPDAAEVRRFMNRYFAGPVPDAAVDQLVRAFSAANRWLVDHPEDAPRLIQDPASVLEAMRGAGALTGSVDELLAVLRSLREDDAGKMTARARLVNLLRPTSARFGSKPKLRFPSGGYEQDDLPGGGR
jgi:hypothetical protein